MYWKLCVLCLFLSTKTSSESLHFTRVTDYSPWLGRYQAQVHLLRNPLIYNSTTYPAGSFLLYGGSADRYLRSIVNDVWLSSDQAQSWVPVRSSTDSIFPIFPFCTFSNDPTTDRSYAIPNDNYQHQNILPLWTSITQSNWTSTIPQISGLTLSTSPFSGRYGFSCMVTTDSSIYCMMGVNLTTSINQPRNDIWVSRDLGSTWVLQATNLNVVGRFSALTGVHLNNIHLGRRDIMYIMGGKTVNSTNIADLWASSDMAASWVQLSTPHWLSAASDSTLKVTADGILLASAYHHGANDTSDVWASLDGGYSWSSCIKNASYRARILTSLALDLDGFLYVFGGLVTPRTSRIFYNDIWKSNLSMYNWEQLATACNTTVPSGGVGLRVWPGQSTNKSSSSSSSSYPTDPSSSTAVDSQPKTDTFPIWALILVVIACCIFLVTIFGVCWACQNSPKCQNFRAKYFNRESRLQPNLEGDWKVSLISEERLPPADI